MIEVVKDHLVFNFPHVHKQATCSIDFQRTLRIPDDNNEYPLPPGFGQFPLHHVDDFASKLPENWESHGGVFLPIYQAEALWVNFHGSYPCAVKVAAGKINAVTGDDWENGALKEPQNYAVIPDQPWLDGFNVSDDLIRQFVAMPLGQGYTAEEQITGVAENGGLQIVVYPMKRSFYQDNYQRHHRMENHGFLGQIAFHALCSTAEMGVAPGGLMRQEIMDDRYGTDAWDQENGLRLFVHLANSEIYKKITGNAPPQKPVTAANYENAGLPWFEHYSEAPAIQGSARLAGLDSVAASEIKKGSGPLDGNKSVTPKVVEKITSPNAVRTGNF